MSRRLDRLDENIRTLEGMRSESFCARTSQWALRYGLLESIQIVIDLACELVASRNLGSPSSYRGCIDLLSNHGLLSSDLAGSLVGMIGLRNLLVHEYDDVDPARLTPLLDRLDDFRAFARRYVEIAEETTE